MSSLYERYKKKTEYTRKLEEENKKKYKEQEDMEALISKTREVGRAREEAFQAPSQKLMNKKKQQQEFLESDDNVGFWDGMLPGGATPSEWNESRKKKKQYQKEVDQAAAEVAAYEQFKRQKEFERNADRMTSEDIDKYLAETDRQIEDINDEGGFFSAIAPGGITPSKYLENRDRKNAIEAEQGRYRAVRDEKKSEEIIDALPADVVSMLDEYNSLEYDMEGIDWAGVAAGFAGVGGESGGGNMVQYSSDHLRKQRVAEELKNRGYENYTELAEYRRYITDKELAQETEEMWSEVAEEHPVLASAGARVTTVPASVLGFVGTIKQLDDTADFVGGTPYSPYYNLTRGRQAIDSTITENFEDGAIFSAKAKGFLYGTVTSAADSAIASMSSGSLGFGKLTAGEVMLGLGAANDTIVRASEKGMTREQAMTTAAVAMASEIMFEHLSLGKFSVFESATEEGLKTATKNLVKESFVNMTEEMATEITNVTFDYYYNGGLSDYYEVYDYYISSGMTEEEAKKAAAGDMALRVAEAGASGGLVGSVFSGYNSISNNVAYNSAMKDLGQSVVEDDAVESQLASAAELGVNKEDAIYKFVQQTEAYQNKKTQNESYKASKRDLRSIGKLTEGLDLRASDKINATSVSGIESRLKALGETSDINAVAKAVHKKLSGEKLSAREKAVIKESKFANRVVNEMTQPGITSSEWTEKVHSDIENIVNKRKAPDVEAYRSANSSENTAETAVSEENENTPYGFDNYENRVKESIINEGQDRERFDSDFELFKQYGEAGRDFEQVKSNSTVSKDFTEVQMKTAFDLGREKAEAQKMTVLKGIQKVEGGEVYVTDTQDNVRKLSEVNTDKTTRSLFADAATYDTDTANIFVRGFKPSASVSSYNKAFKVFYSAGAASADTTFSEAKQKYGSLIKYMADEGVAKKAFDLGRQERTKADKAVKQKKQTGKHPAKGTYQSKTVSVGEEAIDEFFTAISKKTGIDIDRVHNVVDNKKQVANAQYEATKNKMTVSASAENELQASVHELAHAAFAYNTEEMKPVKKAVIDWFISQNSESEFEEILRRYGASYEGDSRADIEEEFVADALGGMFTTEEGVQDFLNWLQEESGYNEEKKKDILQRITEWLNDIIEAIRDIMNSGELNGAGKFFAKENCDELTRIRKQFLEALDGAGENYREGGAVEGEVKNSLGLIIDQNNKSYGIGVILDSTLLDNLNPKERVDMVKEYIKELGGAVFSAYDNDGNAVNITIAKSSARFKNHKGKSIPVNKDLSSKYIKNEVKQEAIALVDELVITSKYDNSTSPLYAHGWLDNNGKNDWEYWTTYIQDKNNTIWEATLNVATTTNGEKILYDIFPIKKAGQSVKSDTSTAINSISDSSENVKYSLKNSLDWVEFDDEKSLIREMSELDEIETELKEILKYEVRRQEISELNIQEVARKLRAEFRSTIDIHILSDMLRDYYNSFCGDSIVSWDVVQVQKNEIADAVLKNSKNNKAYIPEKYQEVLKEIKSVKVKPSEEQKRTAAAVYGSYEIFRRKTYSSIMFSKDGVDLNDRWQELSEKYPDVFSKDISEKDRALAIFEATKMLKNRYEDEYGFDYDSAKDYMTTIIAESFFDVSKSVSPDSQSKAKELEARIKKVKRDYGLKYKELSKNLQKRIDRMQDTEIRKRKRNRLIKTIKRLDRLLRNPGKGAPSAGTNKYGQEYVHLTNIPEGFKKAVIDFCYIFIENDAGVFTAKYKDSEGVVRKKVFELLKQYGALKESKTYIGTAVNDDIKEKIEKAHEIVADKRLAQLTASELDTLNEIADHLITVINNEVVMWVNGVKTKVDDMGQTALNEQNAKGMKGYIQAMKGIDKISVMNLKPIYFFEKVGGTLQKLWNDILGGQDRYVRNMQYAQQRFSDIAKKYHLDSWIDDDAKTFKTEQGHEISLTRGQALLVWATWKREGIAGKDSKHLFEGGIVFPDAIEKASDKGKNKLPKVLQKVYEDGTAHRIRVEDMLKIDEWLTMEQKAYADELVGFLSNDVASWGNEISMQLYGINKFNEKYYIPFNSAGNYLYKGMGDEGTKLLKSEGFTKETQWGANNPLVVDDFTEVVVKHIERMSMYNSMVLPLDNFSRVWNYQERADADSDDSTQNVKAAFETAWGKEYKKYVDNLLRDINGGVMSDSREIGDKWISKFKKAAVMGSASVMIQQPSAIVRAFSEVDTRYFVASTFGQRKAAYEEAKKYAPVAVLKEIGGFDTVGGQSMTDWMLKRDYKGKDKLIAFFKDSQFRDDVISWGPAWADRITWAHIWLACKKEVQHTKGLSGEALLEATGKRFTEVINKTQVYDSVLSRSDAMRSKNTLMKMQTAFMAEPVTQWNMYGSAVRDWKKGDRKKAVRKVGSVIGAQLFNSMLVSIIYSARDDDEEKSLLEKYLGAVVGNFLDSLNPLTLVPFFKDMISLAQGYDVERTDVSVFSNVIDSITDMFNENMSWQDKALGFAGSTLDVFGFPFKNLVRDGKALWNTAKSLSGEQNTTSGGILASIRDEMFPILKNLGIVSDKKGALLYDAFVSGNSSLYAEYASRYKDGKAVKNALTTQIKDRYIKGSMTEDEATELLSRLGYSENDVYYKLREWDTPEEEETEESPDENEAFFTLEGIDGLSSEAEEDNKGSVAYTYLHDAIAKGDTALIKSEIEDLLNRGAEEDDIKRSVMSKWGKAYRESTDPNERKKIEQTIASTGLWTTGEVFAMTKRWREKAEQDSRK